MLTAYGLAACQSGSVRWLQRLLPKCAACSLRPPGGHYLLLVLSDQMWGGRRWLVIQINRWLEPPPVIQPAAQPVLSCRCPLYLFQGRRGMI